MLSVEKLKNIIRCASESLSSGLSEEKLMALYGHRKVEVEILEEFIRNCHELNRAEFFFVSGTPGSGKTFSINQIMLRMIREALALPVYINCFELDSQISIHEIILEAIFQSLQKSIRAFVESEMQCSGDFGPHALFLRRNAQMLLEKCCSSGWKDIKDSSDKRIILLVLDEIDSLIRQNGQPFSEIFSVLDLLRYATSGICVIGISNQVGLSAFEENKLVSRIKGQLIFKAYTEEELFELIVRRMDVFGGKLQVCQQSVRIFQYHAMCIIARKCGGLEGDARKVIHGFNHVLTHFLEQNADGWKSIAQKVENIITGTENSHNGIIEPQFAFQCMESFALSFIEPQLKGLPYLAYVVLAACCRIVNVRLHYWNSCMDDTAIEMISTNLVLEAIHSIATRVYMTPQKNQAQSCVNTIRLLNFAGLHSVITLLNELHIIRFSKESTQFAQCVFQLTIDIKVLQRALRDPKYCPYPLSSIMQTNVEIGK